MTNAIDPSLSLSHYQETQRKTGSNVLGKDDFLKIFMTQLQNQDPTSPMDDKEFIAQMAQFSTLEQMTNMNSNLERFIQRQQQSQLISYSQFIGKEIQWHRVNELENGAIESLEGSGRIVSAQFKDESIVFMLEDGTEIGPENISEVNEMINETSMIQASMMIGKTIMYLDDQKEEQSAVVQSVSFKNGLIAYQLNNGMTTITGSQIIKIE
jgi:flagellar basal-body rod modification protein FlgD